MTLQMRIRPAWPRDLEACEALDHSYNTDRVWQMDARETNEAVAVTFRVARLPREIRVPYPRQGEELVAGWFVPQLDAPVQRTANR